MSYNTSSYKYIYVREKTQKITRNKALRFPHPVWLGFYIQENYYRSHLFLFTYLLFYMDCCQLTIWLLIWLSLYHYVEYLYSHQVKCCLYYYTVCITVGRAIIILKVYDLYCWWNHHYRIRIWFILWVVPLEL